MEGTTMRYRNAIVTLTLLAVLFTACARVAFYSDAKLKHGETGVKFYTPKPYLLVARTGAKDKPVEISIIYLPDLSHPIYAKSKTGLGTTDLSLTIANGVLSTVGVKTDSKVPELLTAIGSLTTSVATAAKTASGIPQAGIDYTETGQTLVTIADDVKKQQEIAKTNNILTDLELETSRRSRLF
jgi:hypothetical protein